MIPLAIPNLTGNERKYLNDCIDTGFVSSVGEYVNRLEEDSARLAGSNYAVATSCGTTALQLALLSVGVRADDLVIIPNLTFIASANAVMHCGASPWLLDVDSKSWTLDASQLRQELDEKCYCRKGGLFHKWSGKRVAAIMPVYTLGNIADMDRINEIADSYGIPVVADAACALGATYKGGSLGNLADASAVSLNGNKTITAGGGGILLTDSEEVHEWSKHVSTTARVSPEYDFDMVGYNYRMTNLQAAVACAQLERLEEFVDAKRRIRSFYDEAISDIDGIEVMPVPDWCDSSCWFSGFVFDELDFELAKKACGLFQDKGVGARTFWKPINCQLPYKQAVAADSLSVSEQVWKGIVTLPCSTSITDEELDLVKSAIADVVCELV